MKKCSGRFLLFTLLLVFATASSRGIISPKLFQFLSQRTNDLNGLHSTDSAEANYKAWIFFTDKTGEHLRTTTSDAAGAVEGPSMTLAKSVSNGLTKTQESINSPVFRGYVDKVLHSISSGGKADAAKERIGISSSWLNAITIKNLSLQEAQMLAKYSFIKKIDKVATFTRSNPAKEPESSSFSNTGVELNSAERYPNWRRPATTISYGRTQGVFESVDIPHVHRRGYFGQGVKILVLDNGFKLTHKVFRNVQIIDKYDFFSNDTVVDNQSGDDPRDATHGSQCLALITANAEGEYVGVAPRVQVYLGRTESYGIEAVVEEDSMVRALEWAERKGVKLASISLGYIDWYSREQLDGSTAVSTKAINLAVSRGITCVVSAGNEGERGLKAPGDSPYAITVGATDADEVVAVFSSVGPTADGRIKPDVCAPGVDVPVISPATLDQYTSESGTSFSTPIVAGVAALLLSANPNLSPAQVKDIIIRSARYPKDAMDVTLPNNSYGWGILNATRALELALGNY